MSAASAIGLFICEMAGTQNESNTETTLIAIVPTPAYQLAANNSRSIRNVETEFRLNVFLSATIHHNITINSPNPINIGVIDSVTNFTSSSSINGTSPNNVSRNWQDMLPNNIDILKREFYETLINDSANSNGEMDALPKLDELRMDPSQLLAFSSVSNYTLPFDRLTSAETSPNLSIINDDSEPVPDPCSHPEYMVFTWILCLIALATGLKLYYLVKTFMALIMVVCYAILILVVFPDVFENSFLAVVQNRLGMPLTAQMNILLVIFLTMVTYHARLVEVTSRLDFIWKEQAEKELANMKSNRYLNDVLIKVSQWHFVNVSSRVSFY